MSDSTLRPELAWLRSMGDDAKARAKYEGYLGTIQRARDAHHGPRDQATWCGTCAQAWPGHVVPDGHQRSDFWAEHRVMWLDFTAEPPDDGECHCCDAWRPWGEGQKHFGWTWWRVHDRLPCDHAHHASEIVSG